jgi:hypothetical protein
MVTKNCGTHKNVIKMGMIVKGVYCISFLSTPKTLGQEISYLFQGQSFSSYGKVVATPFL